MNNVEEIIKQLATEVEMLNKKHSTLENLWLQIQESDDFTESEKEHTAGLLSAFNEERNSKLQDFRSKLDIYQNKIMKLQEKFETRAEVISQMNSEDFTEFRNVFSPDLTPTPNRTPKTSAKVMNPEGLPKNYIFSLFSGDTVRAYSRSHLWIADFRVRTMRIMSAMVKLVCIQKIGTLRRARMCFYV